LYVDAKIIIDYLVIKLNFIAIGNVLKVKYETRCSIHIYAQASSYIL